MNGFWIGLGLVALGWQLRRGLAQLGRAVLITDLRRAQRLEREAYFGPGKGTKQPVECPDCKGTGDASEQFHNQPCARCGGAGYTTLY